VKSLLTKTLFISLLSSAVIPSGIQADPSTVDFRKIVIKTVVGGVVGGAITGVVGGGAITGAVAGAIVGGGIRNNRIRSISRTSISRIRSRRRKISRTSRGTTTTKGKKLSSSSRDRGNNRSGNRGSYYVKNKGEKNKGEIVS